MKSFFGKITQWLIDNHDSIEEFKDYANPILLIIAGWIPTINLLRHYNINTDFGFFAVFGQLLGYIARYNFTYLFPKMPNANVGNWWVKLVGNLILAWTFGIFMTPIAFRYFDDNTLSIAGIAVLVGMFYDLILIPLIIVAYQASAWLRKKWGANFETQETIEIKKQSIVGDGEDEGIDQSGTPVPIKLPPTPNP